MEYKKAQPVKLREVGKDERWLQDRVNEMCIRDSAKRGLLRCINARCACLNRANICQ